MLLCLVVNTIVVQVPEFGLVYDRQTRVDVLEVLANQLVEERAAGDM